MSFWQKIKDMILVFLDYVGVRQMTPSERIDHDFGFKFVRGPFRPNAAYHPEMGFLYVLFENCPTVTALGPCEWINLLEATQGRKVVGIQIHGFRSLISFAFQDAILASRTDELPGVVMTLEEFLANLPEQLKNAPAFKPNAWYNRTGDILECNFESVPYFADVVHSCIHLLRAHTDQRIVGVQIWGFKRLLRDPEKFVLEVAI